jgi:hypothetical protein
MDTAIQLSIFWVVSNSGFAQTVSKPQIPVANYDNSSQGSAQPAEVQASSLWRKSDLTDDFPGVRNMPALKCFYGDGYA